MLVSTFECGPGGRSTSRDVTSAVKDGGDQGMRDGGRDGESDILHDMTYPHDWHRLDLLCAGPLVWNGSQQGSHHSLQVVRVPSVNRPGRQSSACKKTQTQVLWVKGHVVVRLQDGILGGAKDDDEPPAKVVPSMTPAQQTYATITSCSTFGVFAPCDGGWP